MNHSEILPLTVVSTANQQSVQGLTRMQKLTFLSQHELDSIDSNLYTFDPHECGPFSKELYVDIQALLNSDFLEKNEVDTPGANIDYSYTITKKGQRAFDYYRTIPDVSVPKNAVKSLVSEYETMPLLQLIKRVNTKHPDMAVNCTLGV